MNGDAASSRTLIFFQEQGFRLQLGAFPKLLRLQRPGCQ